MSLLFVSLNAQVLSNQIIMNQIADENAFLDASSNFNSEVIGASNNLGKGLVFPTVNLITFEFKLDNLDGFTKFPTYFNGMVVYNNATGYINTDGNRPSTATYVTPGFYYFYNPEGHNNYSVKEGIWKAMGNEGKSQLLDWFYMPSILVDVSTSVTETSINLHDEYLRQFNADYPLSGIVKNPSASNEDTFTRVYAANELNYYIIGYDETVFYEITISDEGEMVYSVNADNVSDKTYMNIVFVVK